MFEPNKGSREAWHKHKYWFTLSGRVRNLFFHACIHDALDIRLEISSRLFQ